MGVGCTRQNRGILNASVPEDVHWEGAMGIEVSSNIRVPPARKHLVSQLVAPIWSASGASVFEKPRWLAKNLEIKKRRDGVATLGCCDRSHYIRLRGGGAKRCRSLDPYAIPGFLGFLKINLFEYEGGSGLGGR